MLYKVLKYATTEFLILSVYFYEKRPKEFIYKHPQMGTRAHATSCRKTTAALQIPSPSGKRQRAYTCRA